MTIRNLLTIKGAILTTAALTVVGVGIYVNSHSDNKTPNLGPVSTKTTQPTADQKSQIDYSPPTDEEKAQANTKTNAVAQTNNDKNAQASGKKSVTPVITSTSKNPVTIYGQVSGVFENGGTCTASFTQSDKAPVTASSQGIENASYTTCPPITAPPLDGGTWQVTLNYNSATAQGTSARQTLQL
jgi:hypothetical protein